jgi:hypothetical protein
MKWLIEFYHERRGILARYVIESPLPEAAVSLGRSALLEEYPSMPTRGRLSLFKQAQRVEGQDPSGWLLYRIGKDDGLGSAAAPPPTA